MRHSEINERLVGVLERYRECTQQAINLIGKNVSCQDISELYAKINVQYQELVRIRRGIDFSTGDKETRKQLAEIVDRQLANVEMNLDALIEVGINIEKAQKEPKIGEDK